MQITYVVLAEAASSLPVGTTDIQVREENGNIRWKSTDKVLETDAVCFKNGKPQVKRGKVGRPRKFPMIVPPAGVPLGQGQLIAPASIAATDHKRRAVTNDKVFRQIVAEPYDDGLIPLLMRELAEEAAALKFERVRADVTGKDVIALSMRRVDTLQRLIDTWFKRRDQMATKAIDMKGPVFRRLFGYLVGTFRECMEDAGVAESVVANVQLALSQRIQKDPTWEDGAKEAMKG